MFLGSLSVIAAVIKSVQKPEYFQKLFVRKLEVFGQFRTDISEQIFDTLNLRLTYVDGKNLKHNASCCAQKRFYGLRTSIKVVVY